MINRRNTPGPFQEAYGSDSARQTLNAAGLASFQALWTLDAPWVEEPNRERRGWSGVCRVALSTSNRQTFTAYLKRQENHGYRSLQNPFRIRPTAYREYQRLVAMKTVALHVPDVIYYGEREINEAHQAILLTKGVPQNISLDDYLAAAGNRPSSEVSQVIQDTAALIGRLHRHHFQHCALYGKHVLISGFPNTKATTSHPEQRLVPYLIDVEKARKRPLRPSIALRDLSQFYRRVPWGKGQWDVFLDHYAAASHMSGIMPLLSWLIRRRARSKRHNA